MKVDLNNLTAGIAKLAKAKVLCVGDLMLDRFLYGSVGRISPEGLGARFCGFWHQSTPS